MRLRRRDLPPAPVAAPEAPPARSLALTEQPEWVALAQQIQGLQAQLVRMHQDMDGAASDPKLEQVLQLLQSDPVPPSKAVGAGSEWFFDVKRGPYNEILNVHARRVPVGGPRPH